MYSSDTQVGEDLSLGEITKILRDNKDSIRGIHFLGGEPLARPDFLDIVATCSELEIEVFVTTNGVLLDERVGKELLRLRLRGVNVSLNGATRETHDLIQGARCFDKVARNIQALVAKRRTFGQGNFQIGVTFVLTRLTLHQGSALIDLCHELGVDQLNISNLLLAGNAVKNRARISVRPEERIAFYEGVANRLRRYPYLHVSLDGFPSQWEYLRVKYGLHHPTDKTCYAGLKHCYVRADGMAFPCFLCAILPELVDLAASDQLFTPETLNLRNQSISALKRSDYFRSFARFAHHPKSYARLKTCVGCAFRADCRPCPLLIIGHNQVDDCLLAHEHLQLVIHQNTRLPSNL